MSTIVPENIGHRPVTCGVTPHRFQRQLPPIDDGTIADASARLDGEGWIVNRFHFAAKPANQITAPRGTGIHCKQKSGSLLCVTIGTAKIPPPRSIESPIGDLST